MQHQYILDILTLEGVPKRNKVDFCCMSRNATELCCPIKAAQGNPKFISLKKFCNF